MARFLGQAKSRGAGGGGGSGGGLFTKTKVFTTPGTTTFEVPADVTTMKAYVIGAGSNYRTGTYCSNSDNCDSGVHSPNKCYCFCFTGHLTGAGGGYAEKTYVKEIEPVAGETLTIQVGQSGGATSSYVCYSGSSLTASNAYDTSYSWTCTNNSTARDNSNDNPMHFGFCLPVCGYANSFSGYQNFGGSGTGGDVNRTGGKGVLTPEFMYEGYVDDMDDSTSSGSTGSAGGSSCWLSPEIQCSCLIGYHTVFGNHCYTQAWNHTNCTCYHLCTFISGIYHCTSPTSMTNNSRYTFNGYCPMACSCGSNGCCHSPGAWGPSEWQSISGSGTCGRLIQQTPVGTGAQPGTSAGDGFNAIEDNYQLDNYESCHGRNTCQGGGGGTLNCLCMCCCSCNQGYDYSYGGNQYNCYQYRYWPGCMSQNACRASGTSWTRCNKCIGYTWTYIFGSVTNTPHCWTMPYSWSSCCGGQGYCCMQRKYQVAWRPDESAEIALERTLELNDLLNDTGGNQSDIKYGKGAGINAAAGYGGGGNRLFPTGGQGIVVLTY